MTPDRLTTVALCGALVLVGALAWWMQLRPALHADGAPLARLPREIDGWRAVDVPLEETVESVLQAEFNLQRVYRHPSGEIIWMYVGYYGTERGGRPEHTPRGCYTGAGWSILETRALAADPGGRLRVNEFLIERRGERRLVQFWYRSHRRTAILGGLDQNVDRLLGRLFDGRADGALVRVSTPLRSDGLVGARGRLLAFASSLDARIAEHWPEELADPGPVRIETSWLAL